MAGFAKLTIDGGIYKVDGGICNPANEMPLDGGICNPANEILKLEVKN